MVDGSGSSPLGITAADMTDDAWDYVFLSQPYKAGCPVPEDKLKLMRHEFECVYILLAVVFLILSFLTFLY